MKPHQLQHRNGWSRMCHIVSALLVLAFLVVSLPGGATAAHVQQPGERYIAVRVDDIFPRDITEGAVWGLFGGTHDEPYLLVSWEVFNFSTGEKKTVRQGGHSVRIRDLKKNQHANDIAVWHGSLGPQEHLDLTIVLMEDDGSILRDVGIITTITAALIAKGIIEESPTDIIAAIKYLASHDCSSDCYNKDDKVGSFYIDVSDSDQPTFRGGGCAKITPDEGTKLQEVIADKPNHRRVNLSCDGHYQLEVGAFDLRERFTEAHWQAEQDGLSPGTLLDDIHQWNNMFIQDYRNGSLGGGAILWSTTLVNSPYYVGGGTWHAYTRAVWEYGVSPGYPINLEHDWGMVRIQDFRGGTYGDGAIIGGAWAELVAGKFWKGYIKADGANRLRNPTSYVLQQVSAGKQWNVQYFEGGELWERGGKVWVRYYDTGELKKLIG